MEKDRLVMLNPMFRLRRDTIIASSHRFFDSATTRVQTFKEMADKGEDLASLLLILGIFGLVLSAALFWCLLSSCMGTSILEGFSNLWEYARLGSQYETMSAARRGRMFRDDSELWELEYRGRLGGA